MLKEAINKSILQLDVIETIIKVGEKILLKPNLLGAHTPQEAATTHPEFVRAVIKIIRDAGAIASVGDSPSVSDAIEVFNKTGLKKVADEEKIELINLGEFPSKEF